ncbi:MAG: cyclic nucleotide-binding domain-containing protein [Planctomycetota bacterium]
MQEALSLLADLSPADVDRLIDLGREVEVHREDVILREGERPSALFVVLEGVVEARLDAAGGRVLSTLGAGELLGEIAWLEDRAASATVRGIEDGVVLEIPREALEASIGSDAEFSSRLHRALGRCLSRRLRERSRDLAVATSDPASGSGAERSAWNAIEAIVRQLEEGLVLAEEATRKNGGTPPDEFFEATHAGLDALCGVLSKELGDGAAIDEDVREELGSRVRRAMHPYLLLTRIVERIYTKPRGYAGDFLTIEWMYENAPGGTGAAGPLIDSAFLERPAARAVRNRRGLLGDQIREAVEHGGNVTSLACGPARELFDVFESLEDPGRLKATCLDIDLQALALVSDRRDAAGLKRHMRLEQGNLVYLATGRAKIDLEPQSLIYSIGLIDYFQDKFVVALLNWAHAHLAPGGKVVLGNFHTDNPDKALMDHVLDWRLIHRSEEDMNRLFEASSFGAPCDEIRYEEAGVNLFAVGQRR